MRAIGAFYGRRFLRILPVYYLAVGVFASLGNPHIRGALVWHLTYTSNFFFALRGNLDLLGAHFWTLAVEEQFYLFWPFLVVACPKRWLRAALTCCVAIAVAYRSYLSISGEGGLAAVVMLPANIDKFAVGGFVAAFWHQNRFVANPATKTPSPWVVQLGLVGAVLTGVFPIDIDPLAPLIRSVGFGVLIHAAGIGLTGLSGKILDSRVLRYLGTISYGLYVYHPFCGWFVSAVFRRIGWPAARHPLAHFVAFTFLSVAVAAVSWRVIERPLNSLKKYFRSEGLRESGKVVPLDCQEAAV